MIDILSILRIATPFVLASAPVVPPPSPPPFSGGGGGGGGGASALYQADLQRAEAIRSFKRQHDQDDEEVLLLAVAAGFMQ